VCVGGGAELYSGLGGAPCEPAEGLELANKPLLCFDAAWCSQMQKSADKSPATLCVPHNMCVVLLLVTAC
jgi:hypothetical protein